MTPRITLSIGRQFGSGGRIIGKMIAQKLDFDFYDNKLLAMAASESGLDPDIFKEKDEQPAKGSFFENIQHFFEGAMPGGDNILSDANIFKLQSVAIRNISASHNCVIMGRCSDYILRNNPYCMSVFLWAPLANRVSRIANRLNIDSLEEAERLVVKADRDRANYYKYFTGKTWGQASSYNLCLDVSLLGIEATADVIIDVLKQKYQLF